MTKMARIERKWPQRRFADLGQCEGGRRDCNICGVGESYSYGFCKVLPSAEAGGGRRREAVAPSRFRISPNPYVLRKVRTSNSQFPSESPPPPTLVLRLNHVLRLFTALPPGFGLFTQM